MVILSGRDGGNKDSDFGLTMGGRGVEKLVNYGWHLDPDFWADV